jgi:hypothetical protein
MKILTLFLAALLFKLGLSKPIDEDDRVLSEKIRLELWSRGAFDLDSESFLDSMVTLPMRMGPVSYVRQDVLQHRDSPTCDMSGFCSSLHKMRGGGQGLDYEEQVAGKIKEMESRFGNAFLEAIERNKKEHAEDCTKSCDLYYCASSGTPLQPFGELMGESTIKSYSMGPVPPEDFAESFG